MSNSIRRWASLTRRLPPDVLASARAHAAKLYRRTEAELGPLAAKAWRAALRQLSLPTAGEDAAAVAAVACAAELYVRKAEFDEGKHPRDHGRFAEKPGAEGSGEKPAGGKKPAAERLRAAAAKVRFSDQIMNEAEVSEHSYDAINALMTAEEIEEMQSILARRKREIVDSVREREGNDEAKRYEDAYPDDDAKTRYLRQFFLGHKDDPRWQPDDQEANTWYKGVRGGEFLQFETSAGDQYTLGMDSSDLGFWKATYLKFADAEGGCHITGSGQAFEVFGCVTAAVVAYMEKKDPEIITFTAEEESRRKLYDKLVKTVGQTMPDYVVLAFQGEDARQYFVVKRSRKDVWMERLGEIADEAPEELVKSWDGARVEVAELDGGDYAAFRFPILKAPCKPGQTAARTGCTPASKRPAAPRKPGQKPPAAKPPKAGAPTVEGLHAAISALKAKPDRKLSDTTALLAHMGKLTVRQLGELKEKLGVKASGVKSELSSKILTRALLAPERPPVVDPAAAGLKPVADRIGAVLSKEANGAPYIDMVITALKAAHLAPDALPPQAVLSDLRRQMVDGLPPLNDGMMVSAAKLGKVLKTLGKDYGELTPTEFAAVLPLLSFPSLEGLTEEQAAARRKLPKDVLTASGLGKPEPVPAAPKPEPATYRVKPADALAKLPPTPPIDRLPSFDERLKRITDQEQSGGAPFIGMFMERLKQDGAIKREVQSAVLFHDLKLQAANKEPLNTPRLTRKQWSDALRALAPDFGRLSPWELKKKVLPHMEYPTPTGGLADKATVIRGRYIPLHLLPKKEEAA